MSFLKRMFSMFSDISPEPCGIDIPPSVTLPAPQPKAKVGTTLEDAAANHGKPFTAHQKVGRLKEPSLTLRALDAKSEEASKKSPVLITDIRDRRKS